MSIQEIKTKLTPLQIAEAAGAELHGEGVERAMSCPHYENHSTGDTKPSASFHITKGLWNCHTKSCGKAGDAINLYTLLNDCDIPTAIHELGALVQADGDQAPVETVHPAAVASVDVPALWQTCVENAVTEITAGGGPVAEYLSRRLDAEGAVNLLAASTAGVRVLDGASASMLAVPLFDIQGDVTDIEFRSVNSAIRGRVPGASKGTAVFFGGPEQIQAATGKTLCLAEGSTDYLALRALGLPAIGIPGAKTATKVGDAVAKFLKCLPAESRPVEVVVCTDADLDGDLAAEEFSKVLTDLVPCRRYTPSVELKDVAAVFEQRGRAALLTAITEPNPTIDEMTTTDSIDSVSNDPEPHVEPASLKTKPDIMPALLSPPELRAKVALLGPARFLFNPFWPAGEYAVLGGPEKSGKSLVVAEMMICTASGKALFDRFACETPGPAIYFSGEGGERSLLRRLDSISKFKGLDFNHLPLYVCASVPQLSNVDALRKVDEHVRNIKPSLVAIDPLYLAAAGAKMSDLYAMGEVFAGIQEVCQNVDASLLLVTHFNKGGSGNGPDRFVGTGPAQWGRVLMTMTPDSDGVTEADGTIAVDLNFEVRGMQIFPQSYVIRRRMKAESSSDLDSPLHYSTKVIDLDGEGGKRINDSERRILSVVMASPGQSVEVITEAVNKTAGNRLQPRTVSENLVKLEKKGMLVRQKDKDGRTDLWFSANPQYQGEDKASGGKEY